jgi:Ca2+-binding EF-hand superfamily protein
MPEASPVARLFFPRSFATIAPIVVVLAMTLSPSRAATTARLRATGPEFRRPEAASLLEAGAAVLPPEAAERLRKLEKELQIELEKRKRKARERAAAEATKAQAARLRQGEQAFLRSTERGTAAIVDLSKQFRRADRDDDGVLKPSELVWVLTRAATTPASSGKSTGPTLTVAGRAAPSSEDLRAIMSEADGDGNGAIDFSEFEKYLGNADMRKVNQRSLEAFARADADGDGSLKASELTELLRETGLLDAASVQELPGGGAALAKSLLEAADSDGDGRIDPNEFRLNFVVSPAVDVTGRGKETADA